MALTTSDFTIEQLGNGNFVVKAQGIYQDIDFVNGGYIPTQQRAQEIIDIFVKDSTPSLANVQNAKVQEIRDSYNQTLASGFNATVGGAQYTFGWSTDDMTHMNGAQTAISKGFLTFPVLYADVHGNPVSIPDQATLDSIQSIATKFMMAQHQQALNLVGQVQQATTVSAVNAISWSPVTY